MSAVEDQIRNAASRNAEILAVLGKTDYAPPALQQQSNYIRELENNISRNNATTEKLKSRREKELKEHHKYHDSVLKRFAYNATGQTEKFATKADKEEHEYFDALREEHHAKEEGKGLAKQLAEAKQAETQLKPAVAEYEQAQKDLDSLYNSIFAGPTPSFPEEDSQELVVRTELDEYRRLESSLRSEEQVRQLLVYAYVALFKLQQDFKNALDDESMSLQGPELFSDQMEESDLGRTEGGVGQALRFMNQARQLSPHVQPLGKMNIAGGSIFRDMAYDVKIKESLGQLQQALGQVQQNQEATKQRLQDLPNEIAAAKKRLGEAQHQLQKVREQIFERTTEKA